MSGIVSEYRPCQLPKVKEPYTGLDGMVDACIGKYKRRRSVLKQLHRQALVVDSRDQDWEFLSEPALPKPLLEFRDRFRRSPQ